MFLSDREYKFKKLRNYEIIIMLTQQKRRLTIGNCSPPIGGSGSAKPQSAQAPLCGFFPPHFAVAGLAAQALIRNRKTSVT